MSAIALIFAAPAANDRVVSGIRLSERGRRVALRAGIPRDSVHIVRGRDDLQQLDPRLREHVDSNGAVVIVRADGWVVAAELLEPLSPTGKEHTQRYAQRDSGYAGALVTQGAVAHNLLTALQTDWNADANAIRDEAWTPVAVNDRSRHPARTASEARQADAWQFELVNKARDNILVVKFYRPLARPFTRLFLRSPITPNMITIISAVLSLVGCAIAASASKQAHIAGLALLVFGGIIDACDGEVARLRLEGSKLGAWLDAMGDDLARLGLVIAIGFHVAAQYPQWPILWLTAGAVALTVANLLMIYWYCIFVIQSTNNQDFCGVLGIGPGEATKKSRLMQTIGDIGALIVRRDFIDLGVLAVAILGVPVIGFIGLTGGAVATMLVVFPAYLKLVSSRRSERQTRVPRGAA